MTGVQVINTTHQMHILKGKAIIIKGASFNNRGLYISTCSRNPIRRKYLYIRFIYTTSYIIYIKYITSYTYYIMPHNKNEN